MTLRSIAMVCLKICLATTCAAQTPAIRLEPSVEGVDFPVYVTHDGTRRLFIVEQRGRIRIVENAKLNAEAYLDIRDRVHFGGECGLLCVAFHPDFSRNGRLFVNYTTKQGGLQTVVSEFRAEPNAAVVSASTERVLLKFRQPWSNHNGGQILFGADGKLYIGTGDGGLAGDPLNSGQRLDTFLGKILRIDVDDTRPYGIPPDNPFVGREGVRPEIWAYGLRNPWRFSFDRATGAMYAADVGQDKWEEINIVERGRNYGWNLKEATHSFKDKRSTSDLVDPIKEYGHDVGLSITGGYVYRGKQFAQLQGYYFYGDYDSGRIWGLKYEDGRVTADVELLKTSHKISSFGENVEGELYVCDHEAGTILRLVGTD